MNAIFDRMTKKALEYEHFRDKVFEIFQNPKSTQKEKQEAITALSEMYNNLGLEDYATIRPMNLSK
jgi:hypothetical protein